MVFRVQYTDNSKDEGLAGKARNQDVLKIQVIRFWGGYPLAKRTVKGATGLFFCWIGLMAIVCIPSFIAGVTYTRPGRPVTLLDASVTGSESNVLSLSNAANLNAAPDRAERPGQRQTAEVLDRGGAVKGNRLDTSFDTRQETLEWDVKYADVEVRNK